MSDKDDFGRRDTLKLATLVAALGAGLSVTLHSTEASADTPSQLQFKFYRASATDPSAEPTLLYTANIPDDAAGKILATPPGLLQHKGFIQQKNTLALVSSDVMQFKQLKLTQLKGS